mmetsp:Transcript_8090/g.11129  ORF Transcript_8090/g.11129 Transcript_8090/m.11129 type:complete len:960 (+) Transcript_8090:695-3574(+)
MLERKDLVRASIVCKQWRQIAEDPFFRWTRVVQFELWVTDTTAPKAPEQFQKLCQGDIIPSQILPKYPTNPSRCFNFLLLDSHGKEITECVANFDAGSEIFSIWLNLPKLYRFSWKRANKEYPKYMFYLILEANVKELENAVRRKEDIPGASFLEMCIVEEDKRVTQQRLQQLTENKGPKIPEKQTELLQLTGLRNSLKLYKYQLDAVIWMKSIEDDIKEGVTFQESFLLPWRSAKTKVLLNITSHKFVTSDEVPNNVRNVNPKGGVLGDDRGLGKTVEVLGLILANPSDKKAMVASQHIEIPAYDRRNAFSPKKLIESTATLVLCPNHLAAQWQHELIMNSNPPLKVLKLSTIAEYKKCTVTTLAIADAVIVTIQFLNNENYKRASTMLRLNHFNWHRIVLDEGHELISEFSRFASFQASYYWYVSGTPFPKKDTMKDVLKFIRYNVWKDDHMWPSVDMVLQNLFWRNTKNSVKGEFKIPEFKEELYVLEFTDIERAIYDYARLPEHKRYYCSYHPNMGNATTLDGLRQEHIETCKQAIPDLHKNIAVLHQIISDTDDSAQAYKKSCEQTIIERKNLIRHFENFQQRLERSFVFRERLLETCQVLNIEASSRVDEPEMANNSNNSAIPSQPAQTSDEAEIKEESLSESDLKKMTVQQLKEALTSRGILKPKGLKADLQAQLRLCIASTLEEQSQNCHKQGKSIKQSSLKRKQTTESDKSKFKKKAKQQQDNTKKECGRGSESHLTEPEDIPIREVMETNTISHPNSTLELVDELLSLIENFGTKIGYLIFYLRRIWERTPNARVILFSTFGYILELLAPKLHSSGIETCCVEGNVTKKTKVIQSINDADAHLILLSSESAIAGANFEASHVILMDSHERTRIEAQKIVESLVRVHPQGNTNQVTLVQFLIRNTVEYDAYVKNYLNNDESQLAFKITDFGSIHQAVAHVNASKENTSHN